MNSLKSFASTAILLAAFSLLSSCQKSKDAEPTVVPSITINTSSVEIGKDGGNASISFFSNVNWKVSTTADWISFSASSGAGSTQNQEVIVTAPKNSGAARTATVLFEIETKSVNVPVKQAEGDGLQTLTISEFLKTDVTSGKWYRVTADIASIANYQYGNFYVADETGMIYVYGLTKTKSETNDQTFSSLGLKAGDKLTFVAKHTQYQTVHEAGGTIPAYYESHKEGTFAGAKASSTKAAWMELPETKDNDGYDVLVHYLYGSSKLQGRSYSTYYDSANMTPRWQAYYLCKDVIGNGSRSDAYSFNPLIGTDKQPNINKSSFKASSGKTYIRGHMVPSAARLSYRENIEVFFDTNIMPQDESFNTGSWGTLEGKTRQWYKNCDTLYIVVGADYAGSTEYVLDNDSKQIPVPAGCYQAILKYSATDGYNGVGFYFENSGNGAKQALKDASMSIDSLEKKLGIDLFVNLPGVLGSEKANSVEAEDPSKVEFWWK